MRLVRALDRHRRVTAVPCQQPGIEAAHGVSREECAAAAWAVTPGPGRRRYRGAGAVNAAVAVGLGTRLPVRLYELPVIRALQDAAYAWVARNRGRFPGDVPFCTRYPERCGGGERIGESG